MDDWQRRIETLVDAGGPSMVFQPVVRLSDGRNLGYEALARFPERLSVADVDSGVADEAGIGFSPNVWFAHARLLRLTVSLEVSAVLAALAHLPRLRPGEHMAINVGPETLTSGALADAVRGRDLSRVVVELTEHDPLAVDDYGPLRDAVRSLQDEHSAGAACRVPCIAVDDVGAGAAQSLTHLVELAQVFDYLKVDQSLTRGIETDRFRRALVAGLVGVGTEAGFLVVAEGIERRTQLDVLADMNVYAGQGWYLGRPAELPPAVAS